MHGRAAAHADDDGADANVNGAHAAIVVSGGELVADATVLSGTGGGCGWGLTAGETRTGVLWNITRTDDSVMLDEDIPNWPTDDIPYSGLVSGTRFAATYTQRADGVCAFRGGTLSGSFSDDGHTFEALETLAWGPSEHQITVQRRWTGRRAQGS